MTVHNYRALLHYTNHLQGLLVSKVMPLVVTLTERTSSVISLGAGLPSMSLNYRRLGRSRLVSHSSPDSSSLQLPGAPVHTRSVTTGGITANADARSSTKLEAEARADARTKENTQQSVQMAATRVASGQVLAEWCSNPTKHHITLPFYMHTFNFQGHKQKHILVFCIVTHE